MDLFSCPCPGCGSHDVRLHSRYMTQKYGERTIYRCHECEIYFSETFATPIAGLTPSLSRMTELL